MIDRRRISRWRLGVLVASHLAALGALGTGVSPVALLLCFGVYTFQMLSISIGYHRYFSHRAFKTSRTLQFVLAFCAQTAMQRSVLWWAAHHRRHHLAADRDDDVHSPRHGLLWAYAGWALHEDARDTRFEHVRDLSKLPELAALDRLAYAPALALAAACFAIAGWSGVVVGFVWGTLLSQHATRANTCFAHVVGDRPYATDDASRNHWLLAAITFGDGWHNNHHRYPSAARHGFLPWEIDVSYYVLRVAELLGLVWELRQTPDDVIDERVTAEAA